MRRILIPVIIALMLLMATPIGDSVPEGYQVDDGLILKSSESQSLATAGGIGSNTGSIANISRSFSGILTSVLNSYSDVSTHTGILDLSSYQVPGWTLYNVTILMDDLTAISERDSLGIVPNTDIIIQNNSGIVTDSLYQEFYNEIYDGKLDNYTITCRVDYYLVAFGHSYLGVRSNFSDSLTNETGWITPWVQNPLADVDITHDTSGDNAILNASTPYYVTIDGTKMIGASGLFNTIKWRARTVLGLETGYNIRGDDWYIFEGGFPREAVLNYTYTPWNTTANAPIEFSAAEEVNLAGNSTPLVGNTWSFGLDQNITAISFSSNQSADINYNITLLYMQNQTTATSWYASASGASIDWNATTTVAFPVLSGATGLYLDVPKQSDWTATGLYNSTAPSIDYGNYSSDVLITRCSNMTNGTWTLTFTAHNYVTQIETQDSADSSVIGKKVNILVDMDIISTIEDELNSPENTGDTNLTVQYGMSSVYAPPNVGVVGGQTQYLWDIDSTTSNNGTYVIEVYWTNGTEAGYLTKSVFVYFPTTFSSNDVSYSAYTDNTFDIRVDYNETFTPNPMTGSFASVTYSFNAVVNASLTDLSNGTWTATVSTAGMTAGSYSIDIYAEAYGAENHTLNIPVELTYETLPVSWSWSDPYQNNISYFQSTNLTVFYQLSDSSGISGATVNATIGPTTVPLKWNATGENYWVQLNGTDSFFIGLPDNFTITVNAWKQGYESRYNDTLIIEVWEAAGSVLSIVWTPTNLNLTYIDQFTISAGYTHGGSTIFGATLRVTFNGSSQQVLLYNATSELWYLTINCRDIGLGPWEVTVRAHLNGYSPEMESANLYVWEDTPEVTNSWLQSEASTIYNTEIHVNITVTDSDGFPIEDSTLTAIFLDIPYVLDHRSVGVYNLTLNAGDLSGLHTIDVTMIRIGFVTTTIQLNLTVVATSELDLNTIFNDEWEQEYFSFSLVFEDSIHLTPISWGNVTLTLDGVTYDLTYSGGSYSVDILLDLEPAAYFADVTATAQYCVSQEVQIRITVNPKTYLVISLDNITAAAEGQSLQIDANLREEVSGNLLAGFLLDFHATIRYPNGTTIESGDSYTTNSEGDAGWVIPIPEGAERLIVVVSYAGDTYRWSVSETLDIEIQPSMLNQVLTFPGNAVVLAIMIGAVAAAAYNRTVKPKKRETKHSLEKQLQSFRDLASLRHFMAVYVDRGTCVTYHPFMEERIQPDLISGFIAAITSVYGEIKGNGVRGTLEEIQYHGLRLNSYSGKYVIGILILEGEMTELLRERLQFFIEMFETQYESFLENWLGIIDCFDPEWIVSTINTTFNYTWMLPHRYGKTKRVSRTESKVLDAIGKLRNGKSEFFINDLLGPISELLGQSEAQTLERLLGMQEKGLIVPIGIQTVLQRQGLGIADGEDDEVFDGEFIPEEPKIDDALEPPPDDVVRPIDVSELEEAIPPPIDVVIEPPPEVETEVLEDITEPPIEEPETPPKDKEKDDPADAFVAEVERLLSEIHKRKKSDE
ncbi:MAG: hypothetical protein ACXAAP_13185 [Candidatus Thorarchaeota archaeon]|jgi:hypothetical protein